MTRRSMHHGFTLLELVVAIVILSILAGIGTVTYQKVTQKSTQAQEETSLRNVLREAQALGNLDGTIRRSSLEAASSDTTRYHLTAPGTASKIPGSISASEDVGRVNVAAATQTGCLHGWVSKDTIQLSPKEGSCVASGGETTTNTLIEAPTTLTLTPGSRSVQATWDPPSSGTPTGYLVTVDGIEAARVPASTLTAEITGLTPGTTITVGVASIAETGTSEARTATTKVRDDGVWDVRLQWVYNGNTVCYGGASSWTYKVLARTVEPALTGKYRIQLKYAGVTQEGADPWGGPLLEAIETSLVAGGTGEEICAPEGNPEPPFTDAKIIEESTGKTVPVQKTGTLSLTPGMITQGAVGTVPDPETPDK